MPPDSPPTQTSQFVLAFGGTGARCAEAITYLTAARVIDDATHVLVIDPDGSQGNVDDARRQLQRYHRVHRVLAESSTPPFFSTPLNASDDNESFFWEYPNASSPFSTLVQHSTLPDGQAGLMELLYDDSDFALSFEKGYIGRAHLGSFDLLRTLRIAVRRATELEDDDSDSLRNDPLRVFVRRLKAAAQDAGGARLLVLGSVFGGTGASGLPAVPALLEDLFEGKPGLRDKVKVGCVQMTPYFTFPSGTEVDPDSALHPLATQSSLLHYGYTDVGYDRIYVVGAPSRVATSDANVPGGVAQRNAPHYAELGAALAGSHFFGSPPSGGTVEVFACGSEKVNWDGLPTLDRKALRAQLVSFTAFGVLLSQHFYDYIYTADYKGARWTHDLAKAEGRTLGDAQKGILRDANDFAARYLDWLIGVGALDGVDLFTLGVARADQIDVGRVLPRLIPGSESKRSHDAFNAMLNVLDKQAPDLTQPDAAAWLIDGLTRAADDLTHDHYQL